MFNTAVRLLSVLILVALPAVATAAPFRLIVTDLETPLVPNSVMDLAVREGYFEREGVEVELVRVQQTPSAIAAIEAGEGEMANIGLDALLQLVARGTTDLVAVTSPNKSLPFLIAGTSDLGGVDGLEGASFGVGRLGSLDHALSTKVLEAAGLDTASLQVVPLGQPNVRAQALAAGQIDATTMSIGVWLSTPERDGLEVLVPQDAYYDAAPVVQKINVVPPEVLAERGDDVRAVIRALVKASRDYAADPGLWADAMTRALPHMDAATFDELGQTFAGSWSVNGGMSSEELSFSADWVFDGPDFAGLDRPELDQWVDFAPLDSVLEELGTIDGADPADR
jgi:NitT/TauT family transport system substrate-binding protein